MPVSVATFRAIYASRNPGLKPWAVLYSRYAAKTLRAQTKNNPAATLSSALYAEAAYSELGITAAGDAASECPGRR